MLQLNIGGETTLNLRILSTGGTIDKIYFDAASAYQIGEPQIGDILRGFNVAFPFAIEQLMRKDSLDMTDQDREVISKAVHGAEEDRILITHGTDTMVDTAQAIGDAGSKVVVMTGALNPARFLGSDAVFNIGCAVGAVQTLSPGVYIAMNGLIWNPAQVRKNRAANRFEAIETPHD